jgi:hypothetical protein
MVICLGWLPTYRNEFQGGCPVSPPKRDNIVNFGGPNFSPCCIAISLMEQYAEVLKLNVISFCCSVKG